VDDILGTRTASAAVMGWALWQSNIYANDNIFYMAGAR
jgi:hypothetical protein